MEAAGIDMLVKSELRGSKHSGRVTHLLVKSEFALDRVKW